MLMTTTTNYKIRVENPPAFRKDYKNLMIQTINNHQ